MRQQPISVPTASQLQTDRQNPTINTPNFQTGVRNRGLDIVQALAKASGVAANIAVKQRQPSAEEQNKQYEEQLLELEEYETRYTKAKASGDRTATEMYYRKILDIGQRGAQDGELNPGQRGTFHNRIQQYYTQEADLAQSLLNKQQQELSTERTIIGDAIHNTTLNTLGSFGSIHSFVKRGHRGPELRAGILEDTENYYLLSMMESYGMSPEQAGAMLATPEIEEQITTTVNSLVNRVSKLYDTKDEESFADQKRQHAFNLSQNVAVDPAERIHLLQTQYDMTYTSAQNQVKGAEVSAMKRQLPLTKLDLDIVAGRTADPALGLTDSEQNSVARNLATNVVQSVTGDLTASDFLSGTALKRAVISLRDYGFEVTYDDSGKPTIVGGNTDFDDAFSKEFERFLVSVTPPKSIAFTDPSQAGQMFDSANTLSLMRGMGDPSNSRRWQNLTQVMTMMDAANPGMFDKPLDGVDGPTLGQATTSSLNYWLHGDIPKGQEKKAELDAAQVMGEVMARYLEHSDITPDGLADSVTEALELGGAAGAAWALQFVYGGGDALRTQLELQGMPEDTKYALNTLLTDSVTTGLVPDRFQNQDIGQQVQELRQEYRQVQEFKNRLNLDPHRQQKITEQIRQLLPGTPVDKDTFDVLGGYMAILNEQGHEGETLLNKALKLAEADGVKAYVDYNTGRLATLSMSRGAFTRSNEDYAKVYDFLRKAGKTQAQHQGNIARAGLTVDFNNSYMERYPDEFFQEELGIKPLEATAMRDILMGVDTFNTVRISQTRDQTLNGGVMLQFIYMNTDRSVRRTRTIPLSEQQYQSLITGNK